MQIVKKAPAILPDPILTFDDTAILMLGTKFLSYEFALAFNDAYGCQLSRITDIDINNASHPAFFYYSAPQWLAYIVIQRPSQSSPDPAFADYDKIVLIHGRDAWDFQERFYEDMHLRQFGISTGTAAEPDPTDRLEHRHWQLLNRLANGINAIDTFGFSSRRGTSTSLRLHDTEPTLFPLEQPEASATENRAISHYCDLLQQFLSGLFNILPYYLSADKENF